ncbi:MAG: aldo/keto reductase [Dehalococcoidia bacterium]
MQYRTLGRSGLRVSMLSYGTGGPSKFGQNTGLAAEEQDALVRQCLDLGVNLFDTSAQYGESEEILGRALRGVPRDSYYLATKWSHRAGKGLKDDPADLTESVERSLSKMDTGHIDVMQFHGVNPTEYHQVVERFYPEMSRLREQGKVRFIGFTEMMTEDPKHEIVGLALKSNPDLWDTVMLKYGILNQWAAKEALPLCQEHNVGVLNMAPVRLTLTRPEQMQALLAEWKEQGFLPPESLDESDPFGWLVHDGTDSVIAAGYKFAAGHPAISTVISGTSNTSHLEANVAALEDIQLPPGDKERLVELFADSAATH